MASGKKNLLTTFAFVAWLLPVVSAASTADVKPASNDFELREWIVFICDPSQPQANHEQFSSTLPDFVTSRRAAAETKSAPSPIGLIRLFHSPDAKVDVLLQVKQGRFLASWPPGQARSDRLLWRDLTSVKQPGTLLRVDPGNWFAKLREGNSDWIATKDNCEQFLLYDAEFSCPALLRLSGDNGTYAASDLLDSPLYDLELYKPGDGGWRVGHASELTISSKPTATTLPDVFEKSPPSTRTVSSTQTSDKAANSITIDLAPNSASAPAALLPWKQRLTHLGLSESDSNVIISILHKHALDEHRLTAVCRVDQRLLDQLLPLEVVPQPKKTIRVGLAIVRNVDPAIDRDIDLLIAQLGDTDWSKREAATAKLGELGPAARPKLQRALRQADLEIVNRAEQLLARLEKKSAAAR